MDSKTIETLSVNAVRESIQQTDYLDQYIQDNDKEPCWDGFVYVYESTHKVKENIKGRVPVQVKGKVNDKAHHKMKYKYPVDVCDMKRYLDDGGAIYFVVLISKDKSRKTVYYVELTPIKLRELLKQAGNKKSLSVELKWFPDNNIQKADIFLNFLNNCERQRSFAYANLYTIDDLAKVEALENLTIPVFTYEKNQDVAEILLNNEVYLYAKIKGSAILQPIAGVPTDLNISSESRCRVTVAGKLYYSQAVTTKNTDEVKIRIGDSFTMTMCKSSGKTKAQYQGTSSLRSLANDLEFLLAMIDNTGFELNGQRVDFDLCNLDVSKFDISTQRNNLVFYKNAVLALDLLNCQQDIDLKCLSSMDFCNLDRLITAVVKKQPVEGLRDDLPLVAAIKVGNLSFLMTFLKDQNVKGKYVVEDFFSSRILVGSSKSMEQLLPQYMILNADILINTSNLQLEKILPEFQNFPHSSVIEDSANYLMLELIKAYDKSGEKRKDFLQTALEINEWTKNEYANKKSRPIDILNDLQIICRQRTLTEDEKEQLYQIIEAPTDEEVKTGAYLILGEQTAAKRHFDKMNKEQQERFVSFPIFNLMESKTEFGGISHGQTENAQS